jgi:two-component system nitrogen regulation response regulator GlnG
MRRILLEEYNLIRTRAAATAGRGRSRPTPGPDLRQALLERRCQFSAERIAQTLEAGSTGVIFLEMLHSLDNRLPADIQVLSLIGDRFSRITGRIVPVGLARKPRSRSVPRPPRPRRSLAALSPLLVTMESITVNRSESRPWRVLIVDDERDVRELLVYLMHSEGLEPVQAETGEAALQQLRQGNADVVLLDLIMPGMTGMAVLQEARKIDFSIPIIFLTGFGTIDSAVEAVKCGAWDYITKPFQNDKLILKIRRALETRRLKVENRLLRSQIEREGSLRELMGPSLQVGRLLADLERVAPTDFTVILHGETGSGKELVARAIHRESHRSGGPFVPVDCGAIQPNLIESELFGHERGAFTGADRARLGKFEEARGGTLFLDEIQNLPLAVQTRFLRALQERQICHVGASKPIHIDLRVVVATNQKLETLILTEKFRLDLYHRLNEFSINVPPLRERIDDILYLARRFIELTAIELRKNEPILTPEASDRLLVYPWPGNVRELRNVMRRAVLLANNQIEVEHLGTVGSFTPLTPVCDEEDEFHFPLPCEDGESDGLAGSPFKERVRRSVIEAERSILIQVLRQTGGNKAEAARLLQIDYKTMRTKARLYGIA